MEEYQGSEGEYALAAFHLATYRFALPYAEGRDVLDLGCGTGYGAEELARVARRTVGVDVSEEAIAYATAHCAEDGLTFAVIDPVAPGAPLPFADASFDVVTSFQVIEHVPDPGAYLDEAARVLRPSGVLLCVTPDRTLRLFPRQRPWNEFHVTEFSPEQLAALLRPRFAAVELAGMTGPATMVAHELRRYRRMRLVSFPFTFPGAPQAWRLWGIRTAKRLLSRRAGAGAPAFGFGPEDVVVGPDARPSVNVVAVARRAG